MEYYIIKVKGAHVGTHLYRELNFYIAAKSCNAALTKAKNMPGVKHDNNAAILGLRKITKEEYIEGRKISAYTEV